jgi:hypothetical protein
MGQEGTGMPERKAPRGARAQPAPLTPPECDLTDFPRMPMEIDRLFGSGFHARSSDGQWRAGVTLWLKAFKQVPAGSLPADDESLARLAELGRDVETWRTLREGAMYGWTLCRDGRYYHRVVASLVLEAWLEKLAYKLRSAAGNAKKYGRDIDVAAIGQQFVQAREMLRAVAPLSRALDKKRGIRWEPESPSDPTGTAPPASRSHRKESNTAPTRSRTRSPIRTPAGSPYGSGLGLPQGSQVKERDISPLAPPALSGVDNSVGPAGAGQAAPGSQASVEGRAALQAVKTVLKAVAQ